MIRAPGLRGAAFSSLGDGDLRQSLSNRAALSKRLEISPDWATVDQVHQNRVMEAKRSGPLGPADALFSSRPGLPVAVFTADCLAVILEADDGVGIAHGGWRGLSTGVVTELRRAMSKADIEPRRAALGPSIGPCCYEVGAEVADLFPGFVGQTTWGSVSVDLAAAAAAQAAGLELSSVGECTMHTGSFSHRRDGSQSRLAALAWIP